MEKVELNFYVQTLERFVKTGECDEGKGYGPLHAYLLTVMNDPFVKARVLADEVCARVFLDMMLRFVRQSMEKERYNLQKSQTEQKGMELALEWSLDKKKHGWQALVQEIDRKYRQYGFDGNFYMTSLCDGKYADDELWEKMVDDWKEAFRNKTKREQEEDIASKRDMAEKRMKAAIETIPKYLADNRINREEFFQAWGLMDCIWNTVEFERLRKVVRLQKSYPEIVKVANKMGRMATEEGRGRMFVSEGTVYRMEHSSKSDIAGITVGDDLNSLLPMERAQCADEELEDLFVYKYLTRKLQNFRYKSEVMRPARRLEVRPFVRKGPMIVCLDTSGSMVGVPEKIASSLMVKLLEIADRQKRDCFLIAFSVSVRPIDVRRERAKLLDFFSTTACGDTSAVRMLDEVFRLLHSGEGYAGADVLWVSDFKIPLTDKDRICRMQEHRRVDTRFYGLQIGKAENKWSPYFDHIYKIGYTPMRKY